MIFDSCTSSTLKRENHASSQITEGDRLATRLVDFDSARTDVEVRKHEVVAHSKVGSEFIELVNSGRNGFHGREFKRKQGRYDLAAGSVIPSHS